MKVPGRKPAVDGKRKSHEGKKTGREDGEQKGGASKQGKKICLYRASSDYGQKHTFDGVIDQDHQASNSKSSDLKKTSEISEENASERETQFFSSKKRKLNNQTIEFSTSNILKSSAPVESFSQKAEQAAFFKIFENRIFLFSPNVFSTSSFSLKNKHLDIPEFLISRLKKMKIKHFFPVQKELILKCSDPLYKYSDIYVCAHTGSGKTLSYAIPLLKVISERINRQIKAFVLVPTRGLAVQVHKVFLSLTLNTQLVVKLATGDVKTTKNTCFTHSPSQNTNTYSFFNGCDILITTPGTLTKFINNTQCLDLSKVEYLVVDEIDSFLDQNYSGLSNIISKLSKRPRCNTAIPDIFRTSVNSPCAKNTLLKDIVCPFSFKMLFLSATITYDPAKLLALNMNDPLFIGEKFCDDPSNSAPDFNLQEPMCHIALPIELSEVIVVTSKSSYKPLSLLKTIFDYNLSRSIVFVNSIDDAERLSCLLKYMHDLRVEDCFSGLQSEHLPLAPCNQNNSPPLSFCSYFSSDLHPDTRKQVLNEFKNGNIRILVTTAVLARGMDIDDVDAVVNYDVPASAKAYVHRVGRTGRAGKKGTAITILTSSQVKWFKTETRCIKRCAPFKKILLKNFAAALPAYKEALHQLKMTHQN